MRKTLPLALAILAIAATTPSTTQAQPLEGYRTHAKLTERVRHFAEMHPELAKLTSIGKTAEGRDIWLTTIGAAGAQPVDERPALLIVAGLEGNQAVGGELALAVSESMIHGYNDSTAVRERLENSTVYIIPRLSPDAVERMFAAVQTGSAVNARPHDDDNDGRTDEDGPDDLDGDGMITFMRVADPDGAYRADAADARLLAKADPTKGEAGGWAIYTEGRDDDGDGFYNEDGPGGVDLDRNFQHEYPYYQRGAGPHMASEPETRALLDFVIAHRNIAMMLVYGSSDNLVVAPNQRGELGAPAGVSMFDFAAASVEEANKVGVFQAPRRGFGFFGGGGGGGQSAAGQAGGRPDTGRRPATTVNTADLPYFTTVAEQYRKITGLETLPATRKPEGALFGYGYYQFGVPAFATPGWAPPADTSAAGRGRGGPGGRQGANGGAPAPAAGQAGPGAPGAGGPGGRGAVPPTPGKDATLLKWMDADSIDGFVAWKPYKHPTLGDVEIGGFKPYAAFNPPHAMVKEIGAKQGEFVSYLLSLFPRVRIAEFEVTPHGGGVYRVKAEVENAGYLPTSLAHGTVARSVAPTMVQLGIEPEALLSGAAKTSYFPATAGSGGRRSFEWVIRGKKGDSIELKVRAQKGGSDVRRVVLP